MSYYWRIPISITLRAPWVTPGDTAAGPGLDAVLARDTSGRRFILSASLIKGNLLAAAQQLCLEGIVKGKDVEELFGTPSGNRTTGEPAPQWQVDNEPERAALIFPDFQSDEYTQNTDITAFKRTARVQIDPELGAVQEGALQFIECPFEFGHGVAFRGDLIFVPTNIGNKASLGAQDAQVLIALAGQRVFAIGGMKSVGFGRVAAFEVGDARSFSCRMRPRVPAKPTEPNQRLRIKYSVDRPFIVDAKRHGQNMHVGSDVLPGGAIKGTLARAIAASGIDATDFLSQMVISHAHPNGRRALPLSLSVGENSLFCGLTGKEHVGHHKFQPDWKTEEREVRNALAGTLGPNWKDDPRIQYSGRTRTRIVSETLTSAYEPGIDGAEGSGQLFSQMAVVPTEDLLWHGFMSTRSADGPLSEILTMLDQGVPGFGKTGAVIYGSAEKDEPLKVPKCDHLHLCLETEACLFSPENASNTSVQELYRRYFEEHGLHLERFYAQQHIKGGYLALRYRANPNGYIPWVMTSPGSVFRLKVVDGAKLADILQHGLQPASGLSDDWRKFPFLRENGFGQVSFDFDHVRVSKGLKL